MFDKIFCNKYLICYIKKFLNDFDQRNFNSLSKVIQKYKELTIWRDPIFIDKIPPYGIFKNIKDFKNI